MQNNDNNQTEQLNNNREESEYSEIDEERTKTDIYIYIWRTG